MPLCYRREGSQSHLARAWGPPQPHALPLLPLLHADASEAHRRAAASCWYLDSSPSETCPFIQTRDFVFGDQSPNRRLELT